MSVPMELNGPATVTVPLDLTVKKEDSCDVSATVAERDGPEQPTGDAPPPPSNGQNGGKTTPLDLSAGRVLPSQPPAAPPSANVAQRPTVVVLSPKAIALSPLPKPQPQPQCKVYWTPDSSSPLIASEHLAPLHGMYADATAYRHHTMSSAAVPEYNPFLPILPPSAATQFHHHNHIQHQQQQLHMQQQHQLHMQQQLQLQLQMQQQQQHHQEQQQKLHKQKLQLQAAYNGLPMDTALMLSVSPAYAATLSPSSSESNHFPFSGYDCGFPKPSYGFGYPCCDRMLDGRVTSGTCGGVDISANLSDCPSPESTTTCTTTADDHHLFHHHHHQQQQQLQRRDLDREHRHHIKACSMDDMDSVDPEEIAAIYRQSDFLSFRHRYMESLGPPRNFEKMRRSSNNNNSSSSNNNNNNDDHRLTPRQQQYDQTYVMKRQKNNEAAKRSRDAKRQKYIENQISVMYLTKKVSEMKDIKRRLLKANNAILAE